MVHLLKNIWMILTLDCQGSAELTSQSFDRRLHWSEKVAVRLHCLICRKSSKLNKQLTALNRRLDEVLVSGRDEIPLSMPEDTKARIARKLESIQNSAE